MRRAAGMAHNPEIFEILARAADEADADAAAIEAELKGPAQQLPPQS
jgi:hypothetical protein